MSPENTTPESSAPLIGPPPLGRPELKLVPPLPEIITIPDTIQQQITQNHVENGTVPTEALVPSREPVVVERQGIVLTDSEVAALPGYVAAKAAERVGADPSAAIADRDKAIARVETTIQPEDIAAAAQRTVEDTPDASSQIPPLPPTPPLA